MKSFAAAILLAGSAAEAISLRAQVEESLSLGGPVNCDYKCGITYKTTQYAGSEILIDEYVACMEGCEMCNGAEDYEGDSGCMGKCKSVNWRTYTYSYNAAKNLRKYDNTAEASVLDSCVSGCIAANFPNPGQGAGKDGKLPKSLRKCTQACYSKNLPNVQNASFAICEADASATCGPLDVDCHTKDDCVVGVFKGMVQPDKACIGGCVQNLCQDGAECLGKGFWLNGGTPETTGCQLITPQLIGEKYSVKPTYYKASNDLGTCCAAAWNRCQYSPGQGASFGVSLGKTAAEGVACQDPNPGEDYSFIGKKYPYNCDCKSFFRQCPGNMPGFNLPEPATCYDPTGAVIKLLQVYTHYAQDGTVTDISDEFKAPEF